MTNKHKLALLPMLVAAAFAHAADEAATQTNLEQVEVRADSRRSSAPNLIPSPAMATCATA